MTYTAQKIAELTGLTAGHVRLLLLKAGRRGKVGTPAGIRGASPIEYTKDDFDYVVSRPKPGRKSGKDWYKNHQKQTPEKRKARYERGKFGDIKKIIHDK
jgi:hypothetical protein